MSRVPILAQPDGKATAYTRSGQHSKFLPPLFISTVGSVISFSTSVLAEYLNDMWVRQTRGTQLSDTEICSTARSLSFRGGETQ